MYKLPLILMLLAFLVGQHQAIEERCRIEMDRRSDLMEECDVLVLESPIPTVSLRCSPLINQTSTLRLCKDTLVNHVKDRAVCTVSASFSFLEVHSEFLPPGTTTACGQGILVPSLVIKNEKLVETQGLNEFFFKDGVEFKVQKVVIHKTRLAKDSSAPALIEYLYKPDELELHDYVSTMPLRLTSDKTKILISNGRFNGLDRDGLHLNSDFGRLELRNVKFGKRRMEEGALNLVLGSLCSKELNVTVHDTIDKELTENNPILVVMNCINSVKINFDVRENGFWPDLPRRLFEKLLRSLSDDKRLDYSFVSGHIDCCNINNEWLFKWVQSNSTRLAPESLFVPCVDIEGGVYNYTTPGSDKEACDKRNQTPLIIIAVVAVIFMTILLLGFSCLCIMYVLPNRRLENDVDAGSGVDGPGNSSGVIETRSDHSGVKLLGSGGSASRAGAKSAIGKSRTGMEASSASGASSRASSSAPAKKRRSTSASKRHRAKYPKTSGAGSVTTAATEPTNGSENSIRTLK